MRRLPRVLLLLVLGVEFVVAGDALRRPSDGQLRADACPTPWYMEPGKFYPVGPHFSLKSVARAADSSLDLDLRIEAASRLSEGERAALRSALISRLPGDWDRAAYDGILLLGEIGDADSIAALERLDRQRYNVPGRFGVVIPYAIERIRQRIALDVGQE